MLRMYINQADHTNWDLLLSYIAFALNVAVHTSTLERPYVLMFGREPTEIFDIALQANVSSYAMGILPSAYATEIVNKLQYAWKLAQENATIAREKQTYQYDKKAKQHKYVISCLMSSDDLELSCALIVYSRHI